MGNTKEQVISEDLTWKHMNRHTESTWEFGEEKV